MKRTMTYLDALENMKTNLKEFEKLGLKNTTATLPIQKAIEALEKQVPKPVVTDACGLVRCPCCENLIRYKAHESRYCFRCGQAIEWTN